MSVLGLCWGATMALAGPEGNRRKPLFPRLLLGLSAQMNLDRDAVETQLASCDSMFPIDEAKPDSLQVAEKFRCCRRALRRGSCSGRSAALQQGVDLLLKLLERGL